MSRINEETSNEEILRMAARGDLKAIVTWFNDTVTHTVHNPFDVNESYLRRVGDARLNNFLLTFVMGVLAWLFISMSRDTQLTWVSQILWWVGIGFVVAGVATLIIGAAQRRFFCGNKKRLEKVRGKWTTGDEQRWFEHFAWEVDFFPRVKALAEVFDIYIDDVMKDPVAFQTRIQENISWEYLLELIGRELSERGGPNDAYQANHERLLKKIEAAQGIGMKFPDLKVFLEMKKPEGWFSGAANLLVEILAIMKKEGLQAPA